MRPALWVWLKLGRRLYRFFLLFFLLHAIPFARAFCLTVFSTKCSNKLSTAAWLLEPVKQCRVFYAQGFDIKFAIKKMCIILIDCRLLRVSRVLSCMDLLLYAKPMTVNEFAFVVFSTHYCRGSAGKMSCRLAWWDKEVKYLIDIWADEHIKVSKNREVWMKRGAERTVQQQYLKVRNHIILDEQSFCSVLLRLLPCRTVCLFLVAGWVGMSNARITMIPNGGRLIFLNQDLLIRHRYDLSLIIGKNMENRVCWQLYEDHPLTLPMWKQPLDITARNAVVKGCRCCRFTANSYYSSWCHVHTV